MKIYLVILIFAISVFSDDSWKKYFEFPPKSELKRITPSFTRIDLYRIPEEKLRKIPTKALIEICKNYPLNIHIMAFDGLEEGWDHVVEGFNGYQELLRREDLSKHVLKSYKQSKSGYERGDKNEHGDVDFVPYACSVLLLSEAKARKNISSDALLGDVVSDFSNHRAGMEKETHSVIAESYSILLKNNLNEKGDLHSIINKNRMPFIQNKVHMTEEEYYDNLINSTNQMIDRNEKLKLKKNGGENE